MRRIVSQEELEALLRGLGVDKPMMTDEEYVEVESVDDGIALPRLHPVDPDWPPWLLHQVETFEVDVSVELGHATLDEARLRELHIGQRIVLDQTCHSEALVKIEGIPKFKGRLSNVGHHKALEITSVLKVTPEEMTSQEERLVVEFGRTRLFVQDLLKLCHGSVIELYGQITEPLDVFFRGALMARGDMVTIGQHVGVRVTHVFNAVRHVLLRLDS